MGGVEAHPASVARASWVERIYPVTVESGGDGDASAVRREVFDVNVDGVGRDEFGDSGGPFEEDVGVVVFEVFFDAEGQGGDIVVDTVEVEVIEPVSLGEGVFLDDGVGGAGDGFGDAESACEAACEDGFAGAEVAVECEHRSRGEL